MRELWVVPIEPLVERYSFQWSVWFKRELHKEGVNFDFVEGTALRNHILHGSFLDVVGTNHYKASQLQVICRMIDGGLIQDNDVLLFHDLWFPGLEMLAYIRDGLGLKFKFGGYLHAGTYDPHDFLTKQGMGIWGKPLENSWLAMADFVLSSTEFNKQLILKRRNAKPGHIHVVGYPWYPKDFLTVGNKENIVIFPHRLDKEKNPQLFDRLRDDLSSEFPDWQFIKSKEVCKTKSDYYELLGRSKIAVSFADQETCGIAMAEATMSGCVPVVPGHLSYRELYSQVFQYGTYEKAYYAARELVTKFIKDVNDGVTPSQFVDQVDKLVNMGANCIPKIIELVNKL